MLLLSLLVLPTYGGAEPQHIIPEPDKPLVSTPKRMTQKRVESVKPVVPIEVEEHIIDIFGDKADIATAVLLHEGGMNLDAKGYNCFYTDKNGKRYSTHCKKEDRPKAWSVDCGLAQINVKGQTCPSELLTLEGNMKEVERIYKTQGLNAWVSYKSGAYKKFLD